MERKKYLPKEAGTGGSLDTFSKGACSFMRGQWDDKAEVCQVGKTFAFSFRIAMAFLVVFTTIMVTRILVTIYNPNPVFENYELHHIHEGAFLMVVASMALAALPQKDMPNSRRIRTIITFVLLVGAGLVLDELLYIMAGYHTIEEYWYQTQIIVPFVLLFIAAILAYFGYRRLSTRFS